VPTVTRVDDSVSSGETFTIYGVGFDDSSKVYASPITSEKIPEFDELTNKTECEIVGKNDTGSAVTVKLNNTLVNGSYNMYVTNSYGSSYAFGLNVARPQWVSKDAVASGEKFLVYGKNLLSADFGANTKSGVSLVADNGKVYDIPVLTVEPYSISCVLSDVPAGEYTLYVSNDGYIWNECEDGRKIKVLEDVYDPYEIGVALAKNYNFEVFADLSLYPYYISKNTDITSAVQGAIDNLSQSGGGVVYIPEGEYLISSVTLKKDVVLSGAGKGKTILKRTGNSTATMIERPRASNTGLVDLSIVVPDNQVMPDIIVAMGDGFAQRAIVDRTIENAFMKRVSIKTRMDIDAEIDGRGIGVIMGGKSHFMIEDCDFEGFYATVTSSYVSEYVQINNNSFNTAISNLSVVGEYATITNNNIVRNASLTDDATNTQGVFMRGFSYVANNNFRDLSNKNGSHNGGEIICAEPYMGGTKLYGSIASAGESGDSAVLNIEGTSDALDYSQLYYGDYYLCITDGRGIGQYSRIAGFDASTKTVTLDKKLEILPDNTSKFIIASLCENITMYDNFCENSEKGFWLYGDNVDCIVANNVGVNTEGVYIRGIYLENTETGDCRQQIGYFVNVEDNSFTGTSKKSGVCGIGVGSNVESASPSMTYIYGINIKNNKISSVKDGEYISGTEAPHINGIYVVYPINKQQTKLKKIIDSIVIENNKIAESDRGITIGTSGYPKFSWYKSEYALGDMTDNIVISGNQFRNVDTEMIK